jgi:hypothetical protein
VMRRRASSGLLRFEGGWQVAGGKKGEEASVSWVLIVRGESWGDGGPTHR